MAALHRNRATCARRVTRSGEPCAGQTARFPCAKSHARQTAGPDPASKALASGALGPPNIAPEHGLWRKVKTRCHIRKAGNWRKPPPPGSRSKLRCGGQRTIQSDGATDNRLARYATRSRLCYADVWRKVKMRCHIRMVGNWRKPPPTGLKFETQVQRATHNPIRWCDRQSVGALSDPRVGHADALNVAHPAPASDTQISGRSDTSPRISHKPHSMYLRADSNTEHSNPAPPNPAHRNTACPAPRANRSDPIAQPPTHSACQTGRRRACLTAQSRDAQKRPLKENL
jgi:hypothetical protein